MIEPGAILNSPAALAVVCVLTVAAFALCVVAIRALSQRPSARTTTAPTAAPDAPTLVAATPPKRPPPETLPLEQGRASALQLRHIFPPQPPLRRLSYLGGAPLAPRDFVWPIAANEDGVRRPLDFMGQIDCVRIPDGPLRAHLPADGALYFFAPLDDAISRADSAVCVRSARGDPRDFIVHRAPARPQDALRQWRYDWVGAAARQRSFIRERTSRIEVECGWTPSFRPVEVERELEPSDAAFAAWRSRRDAALIEFHGAPLESDDLLAPHALRGKRIFEPFAGFPTCWMAIEIVAERFLRHFANGPGGDARADEGARRFVAMARAEDPLCEPSPPDKRAFAQWLRHLGESPNLNLRADAPGASAMARELPAWVSQAAILSCEASLTDSKASARIPADVERALRARHSALRSPGFAAGAARLHQLFGHARFAFGQSEEMALAHHLLMQFDGDEALGWDFGDGAYQYWIRPADLAAQRYSAVTLTFEGP